jgi:hypothetical protein
MDCGYQTTSIETQVNGRRHVKDVLQDAPHVLGNNMFHRMALNFITLAALPLSLLILQEYTVIALTENQGGHGLMTYYRDDSQCATDSLKLKDYVMRRPMTFYQLLQCDENLTSVQLDPAFFVTQSLYHLWQATRTNLTAMCCTADTTLLENFVRDRGFLTVMNNRQQLVQQYRNFGENDAKLLSIYEMRDYCVQHRLDDVCIPTPAETNDILSRIMEDHKLLGVFSEKRIRLSGVSYLSYMVGFYRTIHNLLSGVLPNNLDLTISDAITILRRESAKHAAQLSSAFDEFKGKWVLARASLNERFFVCGLGQEFEGLIPEITDETKVCDLVAVEGFTDSVNLVYRMISTLATEQQTFIESAKSEAQNPALSLFVQVDDLDLSLLPDDLKHNLFVQGTSDPEFELYQRSQARRVNGEWIIDWDRIERELVCRYVTSKPAFTNITGFQRILQYTKPVAEVAIIEEVETGGEKNLDIMLLANLLNTLPETFNTPPTQTEALRKLILKYSANDILSVLNVMIDVVRGLYDVIDGETVPDYSIKEFIEDNLENRQVTGFGIVLKSHLKHMVPICKLLIQSYFEQCVTFSVEDIGNSLNVRLSSTSKDRLQQAIQDHIFANVPVDKQELSKKGKTIKALEKYHDGLNHLATVLLGNKDVIALHSGEPIRTVDDGKLVTTVEPAVVDMFLPNYVLTDNYGDIMRLVQQTCARIMFTLQTINAVGERYQETVPPQFESVQIRLANTHLEYEDDNEIEQVDSDSDDEPEDEDDLEPGTERIVIVEPEYDILDPTSDEETEIITITEPPEEEIEEPMIEQESISMSPVHAQESFDPHSVMASPDIPQEFFYQQPNVDQYVPEPTPMPQQYYAPATTQPNMHPQYMPEQLVLPQQQYISPTNTFPPQQYPIMSMEQISFTVTQCSNDYAQVEQKLQFQREHLTSMLYMTPSQYVYEQQQLLRFQMHQAQQERISILKAWIKILNYVRDNYPSEAEFAKQQIAYLTQLLFSQN